MAWNGNGMEWHMKMAWNGNGMDIANGIWLARDGNGLEMEWNSLYFLACAVLHSLRMQIDGMSV